jgi:hypothetical protein
MKPKLYLESTIPSYYVARPSRDLVTAAHQQITRDWWARRAKDFEIYVSQIVMDEIGTGDREMARLRLEAIAKFPLLTASNEVTALAEDLIRSGPLPAKAAQDAAHIAYSAVHGMHFLLTWNCTHIANAEMQDKIRQICERHGFKPPLICTPDELMKGPRHD